LIITSPKVLKLAERREERRPCLPGVYPVLVK
jgi:hypothetical protein